MCSPKNTLRQDSEEQEIDPVPLFEATTSRSAAITCGLLIDDTKKLEPNSQQLDKHNLSIFLDLTTPPHPSPPIAIRTVNPVVKRSADTEPQPRQGLSKQVASSNRGHEGAVDLPGRAIT